MFISHPWSSSSKHTDFYGQERWQWQSLRFMGFHFTMGPFLFRLLSYHKAEARSSFFVPHLAYARPHLLRQIIVSHSGSFATKYWTRPVALEARVACSYCKADQTQSLLVSRSDDLRVPALTWFDIPFSMGLHYRVALRCF